MSVNTVNFFGYGVRFEVTAEDIQENPELDDLDAWFKEYHPLLVPVKSGNAYDANKEMTDWVFIRSTFVEMWDYEKELTYVEDGIFETDMDALMSFIGTGMCRGRVGYAMIRQVG